MQKKLGCNCSEVYHGSEFDIELCPVLHGVLNGKTKRVSRDIRTVTEHDLPAAAVRPCRGHECGKRQQVNRLNGYKDITIQVVKIIA